MIATLTLWHATNAKLLHDIESECIPRQRARRLLRQTVQSHLVQSTMTAPLLGGLEHERQNALPSFRGDDVRRRYVRIRIRMQQWIANGMCTAEYSDRFAIALCEEDHFG